MNTENIRALIDKYNEIINSAPLTFVLDDKVTKAIIEREELRAKCKHKFENGVCIYCDMEEE